VKPSLERTWGERFDHHLDGLIGALDAILDSKVETPNSKTAADEPATRLNQSLGLTSLPLAGAPRDTSPTKLQPSGHTSNASTRKVAGHVGPSSAGPQTETLKTKERAPVRVARLIRPEGPTWRALRVGPVVLVAVVGLVLAILTVQVGENEHHAAGSELENVRKAADPKAVEDTRKAAEAKAAEDTCRTDEAKAVDDAWKSGRCKSRRRRAQGG